MANSTVCNHCDKQRHFGCDKISKTPYDVYNTANPRKNNSICFQRRRHSNKFAVVENLISRLICNKKVLFCFNFPIEHICLEIC